MARSCPACARPNAETATVCLYCSEPLAPLAESDETAPTPAEAPSTERYLAILIPGGDPEEPVVREFSLVTGLAPYDARLSLQSNRPRLFRCLETEGKARELSERLASIEIPHYVVSEQSVLALPVSTVRRCELFDRHLEMELEGTRVSLPYAELLLLVRGEITRERHDEKKLGTAKGVSHRLSSGLRLHLYGREASVAAEIDPERFDWKILGAEWTSSALLNADRFLAQLAARAPSAELDRGFDYEPVVLSPAGSEGDVRTVLAERETGPVGSVYDNEAQFRFYARWRYRLARHLERRAGEDLPPAARAGSV